MKQLLVLMIIVLVASCSARDEHDECEGDNPPAECCYEGSPYCEPNNGNNGTNNNSNNGTTNNSNNGVECPECPATQVCDELAGRCVDCLSSTDCTAGVCDTSTKSCVTCLEADNEGCMTPVPFCVGSGEDAECHECTGNSACVDTAASLCVEGACNACVVDADCTHLAADTPLCEAGACVACRPATEASDCAGKGTGGVDSVCLPDNSCGSTEVGSVTNCLACEADNECAADHRCIAMTFGDPAVAHGSYCLKQASTGCAQPFGTPINRASISGAIEGAYCGIVESLTTCEATLDLTSNKDCTSPADCGASNVDDGLCENLLLGLKCTYACGSSIGCPPEAPCNAYCGGQ